MRKFSGLMEILKNMVRVCVCVRACVCVCVCVFGHSVVSNSLRPHGSGSSVYGILQARILEWLPFPPPGDLPDPGMELTSPASPALAGGFFTTEPPGKPYGCERGP